MIRISLVNNKLFYIVFFSLVLVWVNIAFAAEDSPQDIVKKYYIADLNGVRLSGQTYESIKPLITWEHEPGWDYAFIVDKIKIYKFDKLSDTNTLVEVRYHVIGIIGWEDFAEYDFNEVIDFSLVSEKKQWKIKAPVFPPHISAAAAIKNLEKLISKEGTKDKNKIEKIKHNIERLKDMAK